MFNVIEIPSTAVANVVKTTPANDRRLGGGGGKNICGGGYIIPGIPIMPGGTFIPPGAAYDGCGPC
jgi:hypothetical protein